MLRRFRSLSLRIRVGLVLAVVLALGAAPAWAYWTAQQSVPSQTFELGTIDIAAGRTGTVGLDTSALYPGASLAQVYQVTNAGTLPLSYFARGWATGALGAALAVKVTGASSVTGTFPTATCGGTQLTPSASALPSASPGTPVAYASPSAGRTATVWPTGGPTPTSTTICVQVSLPTTAANTLQGQTATVTVQFVGEQVGQP
jgi:predicted ribosomally synthesized peptide with SipW-like signal peptide